MLGVAMEHPLLDVPQQHMGSLSATSLSLKDLPVLCHSPGRKASCPDSPALKQAVPGLLQQQLPNKSHIHLQIKMLKI